MSAWTLWELQARPAYAYALRTHAQTLLGTNTPSHPIDPATVIALLDRASAIRHPYDLLSRDLSDAAMRLVVTTPLSDADRTHVYDHLRSLSDTLLATHPHNPYLRQHRAWIEGTFGHQDEEARFLEEAVARAPANATFRFQLALVELRRHRTVPARETLTALHHEQLLQDAPLFLLGLADVWERHPAEGHQRIDQALATYTPTAIEWAMLADAYHQTTAPPTPSTPRSY